MRRTWVNDVLRRMAHCVAHDFVDEVLEASPQERSFQRAEACDLCYAVRSRGRRAGVVRVTHGR